MGKVDGLPGGLYRYQPQGHKILKVHESDKKAELHAAGAYNECKEPQAETVVEKERSTFCDYFAFRDGSSCHQGKDADSTKAKLASLFK